jgi:hypothetical protein
MKLIVAVTALLLVHDAPSGWQYPSNCCGGQDCHPVDCEEISEDADGVYHWRNLVFPHNVAQPTQDRNCHVCHQIEDGKPAVGRCLFIRQSA